MEINLTENTKSFLMLIKSKYKYFARDKNGALYIHDRKHEKLVKDGYWEKNNKKSSYRYIDEILLDIDLSFIKWEDEKPTSITDLLKEI